MKKKKKVTGKMELKAGEGGGVCEGEGETREGEKEKTFLAGPRFRVTRLSQQPRKKKKKKFLEKEEELPVENPR